MTQTRQDLVDRQYAPRADAYVQSAVHASGADLDAIAELAVRTAPAHALDLGTGGGHVAYRLAEGARRVTACDITPAMLEAVKAEAKARGLAHLETAQGAAERLPFSDGAFDLLASRFTAHHWSDFEAGLREARRVLQPGAPAVFIDVVSPGLPAADTHLQSIELLRDPSHVRNYTPAHWWAALTRAGFHVTAARTWRLHMDFAVWTGRMKTPEAQAAVIRTLQAGAASEVKGRLAIEDDGSFKLDAVMFEATAG